MVMAGPFRLMKDRNKAMRLELVPQSARFPIRGQLGGGLLLLLLGDGLEVVRLFIEWWSLSLSISVPQYFFYALAQSFKYLEALV